MLKMMNFLRILSELFWQGSYCLFFRSDAVKFIFEYFIFSFINFINS